MLHDLTCLWAPPAFARWDGGELLFFFLFGSVNLAVVWFGMEGLRRVLVVKVRCPSLNQYDRSIDRSVDRLTK